MPCHEGFTRPRAAPWVASGRRHGCSTSAPPDPLAPAPHPSSHLNPSISPQHRYADELHAARVYDRVSFLLYGQDAITNFGVAAAAADDSQVPQVSCSGDGGGGGRLQPGATGA
jgi:hypothetical protein